MDVETVRAPESPPAPPTVQVAAQNLTIFVESHPLFQAMLADLREARSRIWLESYIILNDRAGQAFAEVLKERARAGLNVRVHYDTIGSFSTPNAFFNDLEQAGVEVHAFHSFGEAFWRFSPLRILNRRNHRKLLVIDDDVAYFGGMNLVDQANAFTVERAEHLPYSAGWRDVHVRLVGSRQAEVAESFDRSWKRARGEPVQRRPRAYRQALLAGGEESIQFFDSGPGFKHTRAARIFARLLRAARKRLTFSMAYFVPVGRVLKELLKAHRRGVFVQAVIPGESDVPAVQRATRFLYTKLLRRRFHIYERQQHMLHSKVLIVDDLWTVVGSANFDARSFWINLEFLAVIKSRALAQRMNEIVKHEIRRSQRVIRKDYLRQRWWQRCLDRLAWSLRWWL